MLLGPSRVPAFFGVITAQYTASGRGELGDSLLRRVQVPRLITDYGIVEDLRADMAQVDGFHLSRAFSDFERYVRSRRHGLVSEHVGRLHHIWQDSGGRFLLDPEARLVDVLAAKNRDSRLVEGGSQVESEFFGVIDPSLLNENLSGHFAEGPGQVQFMSALAVVTGRHDVNLSKLPKEARLAGHDVKRLGWKRLPIDWRRARTILADDTAFQPGFEGYKLFTRRYGDGDMLKAFVIASALLGEDFAQFGWGNQIQLKVSEVEEVKAELTKALADKGSDLRGLAGYKRFALRSFCKRDMHKAFMIASALLGKDFERLDWGHQIHLKVSEVDEVNSYLEQDVSMVRGENGLIKFMKKFHLQPFAALSTVRALVGDKVSAFEWPTFTDIARFNQYVDWVDLEDDEVILADEDMGQAAVDDEADEEADGNQKKM